MSLERKARAYIAAVEGGAVGDDLAGFYHPDVVQYEFPNRLVPNGAQRELADILRGADSGSKLMERQIYDVHTVTELGDRVILEYTWTGYPRTPVGSVRPGEAMRARICQVIEYEDGLIIRQRNYDCFEPF
ncbi:MAG TPA: nuclear transport factor 2 family protein [Hyphomonadaceae bacterium]|jgi:ketosteroid isomerase-like protein|nr:nuclear transport factor 2 family protein [Hyphomonadaceae bacterium]HPI47990.1 nuclear transport factor 2 family protein [Hyphomonadaceae bacterium]